MENLGCDTAHWNASGCIKNQQLNCNNIVASEVHTSNIFMFVMGVTHLDIFFLFVTIELEVNSNWKAQTRVFLKGLDKVSNKVTGSSVWDDKDTAMFV